MAIMTVYVTETLHLDVLWAGIASASPQPAWFFAGMSGIGLPLFQKMIPRLGLSTGLYMNTRRVCSIGSGPIICDRLAHPPRANLPH